MLVVLLYCLTIVSAHATTTPTLSSDTSFSTAGYFQLSWGNQETAPDQTAQYELQQAMHSDFSDAHTRYRGSDAATVISGLDDSKYYYRVRYENDSVWSNAVEVEVKHHPLSRAFGFFALGLVMFVATVIVLLKGVRGQH